MTDAMRPSAVLPPPTKKPGRMRNNTATINAGSNFYFRYPDVSDMTSCGEILNDWIDETPWMPRIHSHEDVIRYHREYVFENRDVIVAENPDDRIRGFAATTPEGIITGLYLATDVRNQGLGRLLLECIKEANPTGLNLWTFVANTGAQNFYTREGFTEVRRTKGDNEENLPDILFRWKAEGTHA